MTADKKTKRTTKLTVSKILTRDSVHNAIERILADKEEITDMICTYKMRNGDMVWRVTKDSTVEMVIFLLENTKIQMLTDDGEEE